VYPNIDVNTLVDVIGTIVEALFSYTGDLASGDTIILDTDKLTVQKSDGTNKRKYFDGEWLKLDPDKVQGLSWGDTETDRDIDITIEKEDRSI